MYRSMPFWKTGKSPQDASSCDNYLIPIGKSTCGCNCGGRKFDIAASSSPWNSLAAGEFAKAIHQAAQRIAAFLSGI